MTVLYHPATKYGLLIALFLVVGLTEYLSSGIIEAARRVAILAICFTLGLLVRKITG